MPLTGSPRFTNEQIHRLVSCACARTGSNRAVLFGPYARDTADAFANVHVLLEFETDLGLSERQQLFTDIIEAFPGCELLIYTPEEIERSRNRSDFIASVLREGETLYDSRARLLDDDEQYSAKVVG